MKFKHGDQVRKIKGSQWSGAIVGTYSTSLTPEGYCVESSSEKGSVQIYPAAALELIEASKTESRGEMKIIKWQSTPPTERGYWWILDTKIKATSLVEVEPAKHGSKLEWCFIGETAWNSLHKYPHYRWAGPVLPPSTKGTK